MPEVSEVEIDAVDPQRFASVLGDEQMTTLGAAIEAARVLLDGRTIWHVNSTAQGGGVAEMLASLLPYACGAGVETRWMVIGGDDEFFTITKRIHNRLHGATADGIGLATMIAVTTRRFSPARASSSNRRCARATSPSSMTRRPPGWYRCSPMPASA